MNFPFIEIDGTTRAFLSDKKDCDIDQHSLIGIEKSAFLFASYIKYLFLDSAIDLPSSSLQLFNWQNAIRSWILLKDLS